MDTVVDHDRNPGNSDTVEFVPDVLPSDVTLTAGGGHLYITINGMTGRLQVTDWFVHDAFKIERQAFSDGTVWDTAYIEGATTTPQWLG